MRTSPGARGVGVRSIAAALVAAAIAAGCGVVPPSGSGEPSGGSDPPFGSPSGTVAGPSSTFVEPSALIAEPSALIAEPSTPVVWPSASANVGASSHELLLLAGQPGAMGLEAVDEQGRRQPVSLPAADVAWLSTSLDGRALATTRSGRSYVSHPLVQGQPPDWRPVPNARLDPRALAGPLAFGSLAPDGRRAAFIAADFSSGGPFDVVILPIPPATGDPTVTRIQRPPDGAEPSWIGQRVVVLTRTRSDQVGSVIVGASGSPSGGPSPPAGTQTRPGASGRTDPIAGMSIAADGDRLAVMRAADGRVEVWPTAGWLSGDPSGRVVVGLEPETDGTRSAAWLAMAPDGERLAVVRTDDDGGSVAVTLHERAADWRQVRRIGLPAGADRAVVAWLP